MLEGDLPSTAKKMIIEWASEHKSELMEIWNTKRLIKIEPLV
jgi:hypothetical protein